MDSSQIQARIDERVEAKQAALSQPGQGLVGAIDLEIDTLYAALREARAYERHGSRESITRQARVERELDKLAG